MTVVMIMMIMIIILMMIMIMILMMMMMMMRPKTTTSITTTTTNYKRKKRFNMDGRKLVRGKGGLRMVPTNPEYRSAFEAEEPPWEDDSKVIKHYHTNSNALN